MARSKLALIIGIAILAAFLVAFGPAPEDKEGANTLRITSNSPPDSLDSGVSYLATSWQLQVNVYNGLLTYKKSGGPDGTDLVPDIATAMPVYSDGGRTLTFHIRRGVMFGPPANREVRPSDIKYTFDRNALIPSQGAFYYSIVKGFDDLQTSKKGSVTGIVADDKAGTVVFHLKRPDATFLYVLALPFSFVVPKGTPAQDLSQKGFSSATGPYRFTEYDPARRIVMERNPAFKQWTKDTPNGKVDRIIVKLGVSGENAVTEIMQGKADAAMDAIPPSRLPLLQSDGTWKTYLHEHEQARTSYIWMNTGVAPFDNVKVRQAVNWAINRRAMVKLGGGSGTPSSTILPPNVPGYTGFEPYPKRDLTKARQLIKESGVKPGKVVVWSSTAPPSPEMAQYLQEQLKQLGFQVRIRSVDSSSYYAIVGADATKAQIGFGSWGQDFPEASNFIDVLLNGVYINPKKSNNLAWYHRKDGEIAQVNQLLDLPARAKAWGRLDREIVEDGAWAPISHGVLRSLISKRVGDYVSHPVYDMLLMKATVDGSGTNNSKMHDHEVGSDKSDKTATGGESS